MKKIKILYEGLSENLGGIETFIYNLYRNMDKEKFEIAFLLDKEVKIPFQREYENGGCKFYRIENRKSNYVKYLKELKEVYIYNKFDIIHINVMSYSIFERITYACKYSDAKIIVHSHNGGFSKKCKYRKTKILDQVGRIFVKKYEKKIIKVACGEKAGRFAFKNSEFTIFFNGIDISKFKFSVENRLKIRNSMNITDEEVVIGLVAMFNNPKNHTFLIDIFNEYFKLNNNTKLMLVGDGYLKKAIEDKVRKLNLTKNVMFLGKRVDVNLLYSAMDVYVMPSLYEGLSISLCEAQINGLKCYTSNDVDKKANITGNVDFISLKNSASIWAQKINENHIRDERALEKVPEEFIDKNAYKRIFNFYKNLI